tara:strand:+ start:5463 stop:5927 length:465 start_codon:yes stop_codon:yes gene_type:complete
MLQKINLEVDHETILNEITDLNLKWFGWNFKNYAKDKTITSIDWGKSSPIGVFSLRFSKHQNTILKAIPQLKDIKFDPKKSHITKTIPQGGLPWHKDYKRKKALLIPIGNNKGTIIYENFSFKYEGPTYITTNILHRTQNDSNINRYSIQLHIN